MTVCSSAVAIVTGGGRGIGRATAEALAAAGATAVVADIDVDAATAVAASLGNGALGLGLDVTDARSWELLVAEVTERRGPVGILVNNAGIMPVGLIVDEAEATARRQIEINVHGVILGTKAVLPTMINRRRGHIVNVASGAGKTAYAGSATYCAAKHAVVGFTEALRYELVGSGIGTTLVMPGLIRTELTSGLNPPRGVRAVEPAKVGRAIVAAIESGRFEVYVPRSLGPATRALLLMPRRLRDRARALVGADDFLTEIDHDARAAYEQRTGAA